ncbi:MAG TPA: PfkB family carbohydrate kinase [Sedimentisphaerales bacterium]|jgi:rfaE bifunctional protein nucleotidyltransferase chain/domain|nr:PfkB family carbohydrate kinase [Sedimentisphaerales bacterium]HNU27756.1 PfkB family carbohydrate kinase [Sedimentisphaerales bacterium]
MSQNHKILPLSELPRVLQSHRDAGRKIVHCHGVFDLLHIGHIRYFEQARTFGDVLVVTLTPDVYVDKGDKHPAFPEQLRAEALASLSVVDYVAVNEWPTAEQTLHRIRPHVYVKGSDFKSADGDRTGKLALEEQVCRELGIELRFTEDIVFSSTNLINRFFSSFSKELQDYLDLFRRRYSLDQVLEVVDAMSRLRVILVGDVIIDEYCYCNPLGASGKSPVLAVQYVSQDRFAGGVLAVANHLANFVESVRLLAVIGEHDDYRSFIESALHPCVRPEFWVQEGAPTLVKRRYLDGYSLHKWLEIYTMDDSGLSSNRDHDLAETFRREAPGHDLAISADFGHGAVSTSLCESLVSHSPFLAVNTQSNAGNASMHTISRYSKADYVSLTERELRLDSRDLKTDLRLLACDTARRFRSRALAVTRGRKGACMAATDGAFVVVPAFASRAVDSIGSGDAFFAISSLAARLDVPLEIVAFLGNVAGALAVQIIGNQKAIDKPGLTKYVTSLLK